jgi:hypothetical protein
MLNRSQLSDLSIFLLIVQYRSFRKAAAGMNVMTRTVMPRLLTQRHRHFKNTGQAGLPVLHCGGLAIDIRIPTGSILQGNAIALRIANDVFREALSKTFLDEFAH